MSLWGSFSKCNFIREAFRKIWKKKDKGEKRENMEKRRKRLGEGRILGEKNVQTLN